MNILRYEFQKKHFFGFSDGKPVQFYQSKWCKNRLAFLIYRILIFSYALAWIIADVSTAPEFFFNNYGIFLTNWTEVAGCAYFFLALLVVAYGYHIRNKEQDQQDLQFYHRIVWIFFTTALTAALATDLAFWILLSGSINPSNLSNPFNIQEHAINYVLLLIDLFVNDIPIRLLHFIYPIGYGLVYTIFTVVLWAAGRTAPIYQGFLDWENFPGRSALVTLLMSFIALPLLHVLVHFWLHQLREWIARQCLDRDNRKQQPIDDYVEMNAKQNDGQINQAYE